MKKLLPFTAVLVLAACATTDSTPKDPSAQAIGIWQALGNINNNNIAVSYDTESIQKQRQIATLRTRSIVQDTERESYLDSPKFKTAVGEWELDCEKRQYRLKSMAFWDKNGKPITQQNYTASQVRAEKIVSDSPTARMFQAACGKK
ncbi:MAG: hypothetical protein Q4B82_06470 [Alysiella sp.]|uniref:surface-adhesin E family protein n=1 Tax=Alysiella sp. TaxID=1872483 RepID=UPI0026DC8205|nr:surface-adhesin E family protein [Alysiella sp.]MDO4434206.1 hypothetical protein [Alysiella sp.]